MFARNHYRKTLGSRKAATEQLNRLACGVSIRYVEQVFGAPTYSFGANRPSLSNWYVSRHCVVVVYFVGTRVRAFSVTAIDPKFHYSASQHAPFDVTLGKSRFAERPFDSVGRYLATGARRFAYEEAWDFGNPGFYQTYICGFNDAGVGGFFLEPGLGEIVEGIYVSPDKPERVCPDTALLSSLRRGTIINTFAVVGPNRTQDVAKLCPFGPDLDTIRMFPLWRRGPDRSWTRRTQNGPWNRPATR